MIDTTSHVGIPRSWKRKREPVRPIDLRQPGFDEQFDFDTLFYDAIYVNASDVILVGPPLYGLREFIETQVQFFDHEGRQLQALIQEKDRVCEIILGGEISPAHVRMVGPEIDGVREVVFITPRSGQSSLSKKRVLVTLQKDNPLSWIEQWIEFHEVEHGIDAALIYDNGSTAYDPEEIAKLSRLGMEVRVVRWNVPYGPGGSDDAPWDSDFAQYGMLEHAKLRYLHSADLVINADIDELVMTTKPIDTIMIETQSNCLVYDCDWVAAQPVGKVSKKTLPFAERRFHDYAAIDTRRKHSNPKWCMCPNTELVQQQWKVHVIAGATKSDDIRYAHFLAMNTNWSWKRDGAGQTPAEESPKIRAALDRVFLRKRGDKLVEAAAKLLPKHDPFL